jgi:hypothetical protein
VLALSASRLLNSRAAISVTGSASAWMMTSEVGDRAGHRAGAIRGYEGRDVRDFVKGRKAFQHRAGARTFGQHALGGWCRLARRSR